MKNIIVKLAVICLAIFLSGCVVINAFRDGVIR